MGELGVLSVPACMSVGVIVIAKPKALRGSTE